jgi:hypothetical protein
VRGIDFSSWPAVLSTVLGLAVVTLVMIGVRLLVMQQVQQRRERANRQINERLRTLIAAYKTLGGSFTGDLLVDPTHLRDVRARGDADSYDEADEAAVADALSAAGARDGTGAERRRRIRDAVEAALSDVILLGTEQQVRLAARAAADLTAGRSVETAELVVSLRSFIREVLDLEPVPSDLVIPKQGPSRPSAARAGGRQDNSRGEGRERSGGARGGGAGGGAAAGAGGIGVGGLLASGDAEADR